MSYHGDPKEYIARNERDLLETWADRDNFKTLDAWAKNSDKVQEFIKQEFLNDTRSSEYDAFYAWCLDAYADRPEPEREDR